MPFTPDQRRSLEAIVDTLIPSLSDEEIASIVKEEGGKGLTTSQLEHFYRLSYKDMDVVNRIEESLSKFSTKAAFGETQLLLTLLCYRPSCLLLTKRYAVFADLPRHERQQVLLDWGTSPIPLKRQAVKALKAVALICFYAGVLPSSSGPLNPTWAAIGYPGPDPARDSTRFSNPSPPHHDFKFIDVPASGLTLEADIIIVGSGAGGGVAAGVLSSLPGKRVIVIEKGMYYHPKDMTLLEKDAFEKMYEQGGLLATKDFSVAVLAGATFGGGTTVNWSCSLRTPSYVREEWANSYGLTQFLSPEFQDAVDCVCKRINVQKQNVTPNKPNSILINGIQKLGGTVEIAPQNATGTHDCGWCCFGCKYGEKQGTVRTWLTDAARNGAKFLQGVTVDRVLQEGGKATGIVGKASNGGVVNIKAPVVVVSGGSIHTPLLLRRSGLTNSHIGSNLRLHPCSGVVGLFAEEVNCFNGGIMTTVSNDLANIHGDHYGVKLEVPSVHPGLVSSILPWEGAAKHKARMLDYKRAAAVLCLSRDKGSGSVSVDADGYTVIKYDVSSEDQYSIMEGLKHSCKILVAAGALELGTPQNGIGTYKTTPEGLNDPKFHEYLAKVEALGVQKNHTALFSAHQMGTAKMGVSPAASATNPDGQTWEVENLYVCDTSLFPTPSGANPMVTCESIAYMVAQRLRKRLDGGSKL